MTLALASVASGSVFARCEEHAGPREASPAPQRGEAPVEWQAPIEVAHGPARAGPWRMNESSFLYVDDGTVALANGMIGLAWVDNTRKDVMFRTYDEHGRSEHAAVNVSQSPAVFSWLPRVILAEGRVFMVWQEIVFSGGSHGGDIFFARSDDGGRSFGAPVNLSNSKAGDGKGQITREHWHNGSLDLRLLAEGALVTAWTAYEGSLFVSRSEDAGSTWSPPVDVPRGDRLPARAPALAAAGRGALYLAWSVGLDPSAGIRLAHSTDGGRTFGSPSIIRQGTGYADAPKLAVDAAGTLHLAYTTSLAGFFGPYEVCYTRSITPGNFESPRVLAGPPHGDHGASFPALALDRRGNVYLAWEHHPDSRGQARGLGFSYSHDGGDSFTRPTMVPGTAASELGVNGSRQGKLSEKLGISPAGGVAVVDTRFHDGERSVVRLITGRLRN
ncbi:MAG TPA: sialidase family protein [Polyangiaceae bacterium]|nr:sialidase family protein [Polyangiaceae bacterium]